MVYNIYNFLRKKRKEIITILLITVWNYTRNFIIKKRSMKCIILLLNQRTKCHYYYIFIFPFCHFTSLFIPHLWYNFIANCFLYAFLCKIKCSFHIIFNIRNRWRHFHRNVALNILTLLIKCCVNFASYFKLYIKLHYSFLTI